MQNFIVLGIVPGTNLQITFTSWAWLLAALATFFSRHALLAAVRAVRCNFIICRAAWKISGGEPVRPDMLSLSR